MRLLWNFLKTSAQLSSRDSMEGTCFGFRRAMPPASLSGQPLENFAPQSERHHLGRLKPENPPCLDESLCGAAKLPGKQTIQSQSMQRLKKQPALICASGV